VTELEQSVDGLQNIGARAGDVTCKFAKGVATSTTWPFYEATYEITVREAVSGRVITTSSLPGDATPEASCPSFAVDRPETVVGRSLAETSLGEMLRPLVYATV